MASRDEILADFQACTGIEDVGLAISQLEEADWVLVDAVNKALPTSPTIPQVSSRYSAPDVQEVSPDARDAPPPPPVRIDSVQVEEPMDTAGSVSRATNPFGYGSVSVPDEFMNPGPSSSSGPKFRMLEFFITHKNQQIHLRVPDNEDIKTLKTLIQGETGYSPCQQSLRGFKANSPLPPSDSRKLSELNLPRENFLHLVTPEAEDKDENGEVEILDKTPAETDFKILLTDESNNNQTYTLNFRPFQTVLGVKLDVSNLTDIPVSKQIWKGWPPGTKDQQTLAQIGLPQEHHLTVNRSQSALSMPILDEASGSTVKSSKSKTGTSRRKQQTQPDSDSDDDLDEDTSNIIDDHDMDDDDDIFVVSQEGESDKSTRSLSRRPQPLIPDDYGDEVMAALKFSEEFASRYGTPHPNFFPGTLADAVKESCNQPAKQRKMLAIYFHHDSSVLSNVFCAQALCADSVVAFLNTNFVCFGWDLTFQSNKQRAIKMITDEFGSVAAAKIKHLDIEQLPILALVCKLRGTVEICQLIHGTANLDELMSQLLVSHEGFNAQLAVEIREEEEREARDAVKREQDLAFEMAQLADREKEAQRQREEEERLRKDKLEAEMKAKEEEERQKEEQVKEEKRQKIAKRLPSEPSSGVKHARIRFRIGSEKTLERRFLPSAKLQTLLDYLTVEGYPEEEYKVLSSWPRRDLTSLDPSQTLEELKLYPQETLTLEEK